MRKKRTDNVVALKPAKNWEREAKLHAEVLAKDDPSEEARVWYQKELDSKPDKWRRLGDLIKEATDYALKKFWLGYATKESVKRGAELLKAELGFDTASPLERLLIEQAVMCHIRLGMVEHLYSRQLSGSYRFDVGAHWEMRLTLAQRRYMKAITTLARVRCLLARAEAAREAASKARSGRTLAVLKQISG